VSGTPPAPGELGELREVDAGLRAANTRLRELLATKDAQIEALTGQLEELRAQVADLAAQVRQNPENSSRPSLSDRPGKPAPKSLRKKTSRKPGRPRVSRARPWN
jgi:transposase